MELKFSCNWQQNTVTSDNTGAIGGLNVKISSGSEYGNGCGCGNGDCHVWRAFDGNSASTNSYCPYVSSSNSFVYSAPYNAANANQVYIQIEFKDKKVGLEGFRLSHWFTGWGMPDDYVFAGSNDGVNWTKIDKGSDNTSMDNHQIYTIEKTW